MYTIYFTPQFERSLKKLVKNNPQLKAEIRKRVKILAINPKSSKLRLHKLSGQHVWAISVTSDIRILFTITKGIIYCLRIGSHDDVY